jgi:hypothetical protein
VDASTLNFTLSTSPLVSKPGRAGSNFVLSRIYNSSIIKLHINGSSENWDSIGVDPKGWTSNIGGDLYWTQMTQSCTYNGNQENYTLNRDFRFYDPSGTSHFYSFHHQHRQRLHCGDLFCQRLQLGWF